MDAAALNRDMAIAQRRQSVALVLLGVFAVADPEQRQLHQPDNGGEHALPRQPGKLQILLDPGADQRQRAAEH